jgi:arylsulfatase A-like enzyme
VPITLLAGLDAYLMYMTPGEVFRSASLLLLVAAGTAVVVAVLPNVLFGVLVLARVIRMDAAARVLSALHLATLLAVSLYWFSRILKRWIEASLGVGFVVPWEAKYWLLGILFVAGMALALGFRRKQFIYRFRSWMLAFRPAALVVFLAGVVGVFSSGVSLFDYDDLKSGTPIGKRTSLPNVILITADALTAEDMSLYGYQIDTTPNLLAFGRASYVFDNFFSDSNSTTASVNSLLTGKHVDTHGAYQIWSRALPGTERENFVQILRDSGYITAAFVANPAAHPLSGRFSNSFDYLSAPPNLGLIGMLNRQLLRLKGVTIFPLVEDLLAFVPLPILELLEPQTSTPHPAEAVFGQAASFLDRFGAKAPIFAWIHVYPPHTPYLPPPPFMYSLLPDHVLDRTSPQVVFAGGDLRARQSEIEKLRLRYDENVQYADNEIGRFLELLKAGGYWDDSVIVITADHGESFTPRWVFHGGPRLNQSLIHIPFMFRFPRQMEGARISALGQQSDLGPTLLQVLSLDMAAWMEGQSLLPAMRGGREIVTQPKFSMTLERSSRFEGPTKGTYAVMNGRFKYVRYLDRGGHAELYDLASDPHETRDLASSRPEIAASMDAVLQARLRTRLDSGRKQDGPH